MNSFNKSEAAILRITRTVVEMRLCSSLWEVMRGTRHLGSTSSFPTRFRCASTSFTKSWTKKYFASCNKSRSSLRLSGNATVPSLRKFRIYPKYWPFLSMRIQPETMSIDYWVKSKYNSAVRSCWSLNQKLIIIIDNGDNQ